MATRIRRGKVNVVIPDKPKAQVDVVKADVTRALIHAIRVFINERDSIEKVKATMNVDGTPPKVSQLSGIKDPTTEKNLNDAFNATRVNEPVYARDINHMINYLNELTRTTGAKVSTYQVTECAYPQRDVTIIKYNKETVIPDMQLVDPVTGEPVHDADGNPVMVKGLRNPVPLLDSDGNPTYYTVTGKQIFVEGPNINIDETQKIIRCTNISIVCPNRVKMTGYGYVNSPTPDNIVYACSNTKRNQIVFTNNTSSALPVPNVAVDEKIKADTFNLIIDNLMAINTALNSYKDWFGIDDSGGSSHCDGTCQLSCQTGCQVGCQTSCQTGCQVSCQTSCQNTCQLSCQVACQTGCQVACQHCHGGTCHNQNCGGWS